MHVRLTKEQAAALAEIHKFSEIPTYFVVNKEGKITYQKIKKGDRRALERLTRANSCLFVSISRAKGFS